MWPFSNALPNVASSVLHSGAFRTSVGQITWRPDGRRCWRHSSIEALNTGWGPISTIVRAPGIVARIESNAAWNRTGSSKLFNQYPESSGTSAAPPSTADTNRTRGFIYVNGTEIRRNIEENQTGGTITVGISTDKRLTPGDIVTIHAQKVGSGSNLAVKVKEFIMYRIGDSLGA